MRANRITCTVAALVALACLVASNRPEAAAALAFIVCTPLASGALGVLVVARTRLSFELESSCTVGDDLALKIELLRPRPFKTRVELVFRMENLLTGSVVEQPVSLSPTSGTPERFELALRSDCPGTVRVELASARTRDALGFFELELPEAALKTSYTVFPQLADLTLHTKFELDQDEAGTSFDLNRPGTDRSEMFETRGFEQGDSFKDVHWKLSARTRDLVVRVPSRPSDHDIALVCGAHPIDSENSDQVSVLAAELCLVASVSLGLLRAGSPHMLVHPTPEGLDAIAVENLGDFYGALDTLLASPLQHEVVSDPSGYAALRAEEGISKTIVVTDLVNDEMFGKLGGPAQTSVVHVSASHATGSDEGASGVLLHVAAADVPARIKSLEL